MKIEYAPEGYMVNGQGHHVPVDQVKPLDILRDEFVWKWILRIVEENERMAQLKADMFEEYDALRELAATEYDTQLLSDKGNGTVRAYSNAARIEISRSDLISFDDLEPAKLLIDECIQEWSQDARQELVALIDQAFKPGRSGRISRSAIMGLMRLDITDPRWLRAMDAIRDAIRVDGTKDYIRAYVRTGRDRKLEMIPLDFAKIGRPFKERIDG